MRSCLVRIFRRFLRFTTGGRVCQGAFRGMRYLDLSHGSVYGPKLLGSYERELTRVIEGLPRLRPSRCVDIGAAEGYYAVGLARLLGCPVTCFEMEAAGRELIRRMAQANGVADQLTILGCCDPPSLLGALRNASSERVFLLCDVEGYEDTLLDPELVPGLRHAWMLVELHEFVTRGVTDRLVARFRPTHEISLLREQPRGAADFPPHPVWARVLPPRWKIRLLREGRPEPMAWLWLEPRSAPGPAGEPPAEGATGIEPERGDPARTRSSRRRA